MTKVVYVERSPGPFVSIEKVFREIARCLPRRFHSEFQKLPFGWKGFDTLRNLLFFNPQPADIYHITGHVHYIAFRLPSERTVLSIMDVRFVVLKRGVRRYVLKKLYLEWPLRRLRYVTAISEKVKEEIVELTGCDPARIRVMDLPLLSHMRPSSGPAFDEAKPLILQVGTMPNKNVKRLADALREIKCRLVIVGELDQGQRAALIENSIEYENHINVSDEKIRELYSKSDMVTFCSTYEGFGLPIIEAQAMMKPLVTSNIGPMKDIAGDGACLVDPFSVESIREGVNSIITNPERRRSIVEAGERNIGRFQSDRVSAQYASLYDEILETLK